MIVEVYMSVASHIQLIACACFVKQSIQRHKMYLLNRYHPLDVPRNKKSIAPRIYTHIFIDPDTLNFTVTYVIGVSLINDNRWLFSHCLSMLMKVSLRVAVVNTWWVLQCNNNNRAGHRHQHAFVPCHVALILECIAIIP